MSLPSVRRTKIVATLGPAWDSREQMAALLDAGVDVVRVNASHGTPDIRGLAGTVISGRSSMRGARGRAPRSWSICTGPGSGWGTSRNRSCSRPARMSSSRPRPTPRARNSHRLRRFGAGRPGRKHHPAQ